VDSNFNNALQLVLNFEGGYTDDPADHGGATNKGIIQTEYDAYKTSLHSPTQSVKYISDAEVRDIYYKKYWLVASCDKLPVGIDTLQFDAAVNVGPVQAAKFLQRAVGVKDDGVIGNQTLSAINIADPKVLIKKVCLSRINFYIDLVIKDVTQLKFLKGWINRVMTFI
jgi:lysozyme family protein